MKKSQVWLPRIAFLMILFLFFVFTGCSKSDQKIKIDTEYKAVFLDNGGTINLGSLMVARDVIADPNKLPLEIALRGGQLSAGEAVIGGKGKVNVYQEKYSWDPLGATLNVSGT